MKKKPLYAVHFNWKMQPVKAVDTNEATMKFLRKYPKLSLEDVLEVSLIETDSKHYNLFSQSAI